jgi:hypothetical protein
MKKLQLIFVLASIELITTSFIFVEKLSGDLSELASQTNVNFEFTYNNMSVGSFENEVDYVNNKAAELNLKEADKGDL